jgi:hypothetical protein
MATSKQVEATIALRNQVLKEKVTYVFLGCYVVLIVFIIVAFCVFPWRVGAITTVLETVLTVTITPMAKHFFKAREAGAESDRIEGGGA